MPRRRLLLAFAAATVVLTIAGWWVWRRAQRSVPDDVAADNKAPAEQVEIVERAFRKRGILPGRSLPDHAAEGIPPRYYYMPADADDDDLDDLPRVPFRFGLVFPAGRVTGNGLKKLARRRNLVYLDLTGSPLTDDGLEELTPLSHLGRLNVSHTKIGDEGLKRLAPLPNLSWLELRSTRVTENGLRELGAFKALKVVRLDPELLTDASVATLRELNLLHSFGWGKTFVRDDRSTTATDVASRGGNGLLALSPLQVVACSLSSTKVTDVGLQVVLRTFPNLVQLELSAHPFSGESLRSLASLKNFRTLMLGPEQIRDDVLTVLTDMRKLHTLVDYARAEMPPRDEIVVDGQLRMSPATPTTLSVRPVREEDIVTLDLGNSRVTDEGLRQVARLPNLRALILSRTAVTDAGVAHLGELKKLEIVMIQETKITEAGRRRLNTLLPKCTIHWKFPSP